jgi:leader peptidase (prepilin peptidase)/N-methyltransferase
MVLSVCLVTASLIDLEHRIIPNSINFFIGITGIFFMLMGWTVSLKDGLLGFIAGGGVLLGIGLLSLWILKKEGMGGGDIKLAAVCGLYLGLEKTICHFFIASYLALIIILVLFSTRRLKKGQYLPFGPFLSAGAIIVILFYEDILYYYYRLVLG